MSIAEKIAKLIAKADSSTHEAEAETFMAKAHEMMRQHGIDLIELGRIGDDPIGKTENAYVSSDGWKDKIAAQLARYYGLRLVRTPHTRTSYSYIVFGRESGRLTFSLMLPFVLRQVAKLSLAEAKASRYATPARARSAIASALAVRIWQLTERDTAPMEGSGLNALVPVDLIEREVEDTFPYLRTMRQRFAYDDNAASVADTVSINRQTPAPAGAAQIA